MPSAKACLHDFFRSFFKECNCSSENKIFTIYQLFIKSNILSCTEYSLKWQFLVKRKKCCLFESLSCHLDNKSLNLFDLLSRCTVLTSHSFMAHKNANSLRQLCSSSHRALPEFTTEHTDALSQKIFYPFAPEVLSPQSQTDDN